MTVLPEDQRLIGISPRSFEHPADRAATAALHAVPMLDTVVRKLIELGYERSLRQNLLAASVKLGPDQLPEVWADYRAALSRLDLPEVYDLYLTQYPLTNAAAVGSGKPIIVLTSQAVELFDELELRTVLGHEVGHVLADHVLYMTALEILLALGTGPLPSVAGVPLLGGQAGAARVVPRRRADQRPRRHAGHPRPMATCRTLMVISAGATSRRLNLDASARRPNTRTGTRAWTACAACRARSPRPTRCRSAGCASSCAGCSRANTTGSLAASTCGADQERGARDEATDAFAFYSERFRGFFRDASDTVSKVGDQLGDATGKLGEWMRGTLGR